MTKRIAKQIIKEFWIQIIASVFWGIYRVYVVEGNENKLTLFITNFSASLFLLSWFLGQYVRIRKQQKIEDEFGTVKSELSGLVKRIESQTKDLMGYAMGGDSIGYFTPSIHGTMILNLDFLNQSEYPVFDVAGEWIDLDENIEPDKGRFWTRHQIMIGDIYPSKIAMGVLQFDMSTNSLLRINIFLRARNGNVTQQFRIIKLDGSLKIAYQTIAKDFKENKIPEDFPGYDSNDPEKVFK